MLFSFSAQAVIGDYNKPVNGTLAASEWNNLINDFVAKSGARLDGYFSINTATSSSYALDINGSLRATNFSGAYTGTLNAGNISAGTFGANTGGGNYNFLGNLGIGIGTSTPNSAITLGNNRWISALNSAGTGYVNMFRVNANDEIEVGGALNIGQFQFPADSGFNTFVDMPVTNSSASGTIMGYTMKVDGDNILNVYSESNGIGGVQNRRIGIGTSTPRFTLDVAGIINATALYVNGSPYIGSQWTTQGTSIYYNTGNVGIGITNPGGILHLAANTLVRPIIEDASDTAAYRPILDFMRSRGTLTSKTAVQYGDYLGDFYFRGYDGSSSIESANFGSVVDNTVSAGLVPAAIYFKTRNFVGGVPLERMRISSSGNVGIGTTTPASSLDVNGLIKMRNSTITSNEDVINKGYLDSALASSSATIITQIATSSLWQGNLTGNIWSNNSGNVGIGTTNPGSNLDVRNAISVGTTGANAGSLIMQGELNMPTLVMKGWIAGGHAQLYTSSGVDRFLQISNTDASKTLGLLVEGNVGIGTTNPAGQLEIRNALANYPSLTINTNLYGAEITAKKNGGTFGILYLKSEGGEVRLSRTASENPYISGYDSSDTQTMRLNTNGNSFFAGGNVGIGTTSPATRLTVVGSGNYSIDAGNFRVGNVAAPVDGNDAVTKSYMDSAINSATSSITLWGGATTGNIWSLASGNVGIGTTSPDQKITIAGNIYPVGNVQWQLGGSGRYFKKSYINGIELGQGDILDARNISSGAVDLSIYAGVGRILKLGSNGTQGEVVISSGNVGIGTTNPLYLLDVNKGANNAVLHIGSGTYTPTGNLATQAFFFENAGASNLYSIFQTKTDAGIGLDVTNAGNVGIGTSTPESKLSVSNGNILINDAVITSGTPKAAVTKEYLDSSLSAFNDENNLWKLNGANLYASTSSWNIGIGTSTPSAKLELKGSAGTDIFKITNSAGNVAFQIDNSNLNAKFWQSSSAGSPSISFISDINTGIFHPANGVIGLSNSGTEAMRISGGNVGIGVTAPLQKLELLGNVGLSANGKIGAGTGFSSIGGPFGGSATIEVYNGATGDTTITNSFSDIILSPAGNVGIGTTTPGTRLTVFGSGNYSIDAGNFRVGNVAAPVDGNDAVTKSYMDSAISSATSSITLWGGNTSGNIWSLNSGNVGVGTTSPSYKFNISANDSVDANNVTTNSAFALTSPGESHGMYMRLLGNSAGISGSIYSNQLIFKGGNASEIYAAGDMPLVLGNNATERMRIASGGNVGIGITNPGSYKLNVAGNSYIGGSLTASSSITVSNGDISVTRSGSYANFNNFTYSDVAWQGPRIGFNRYRGTASAPTTAVNGDTAGWFDFFAYDGAAAQRVGMFGMYIDGAVSSGIAPGRFIISTTNSSGASINRLIAYSNDNIVMATNGGNVGIGTTTLSAKLSLSGGNVFINDAVITSGTPKAAITKEYLDSSLTAFNDENNLWKLNGSSLYSSSTSWNVGIGNTNPQAKIQIGTWGVVDGGVDGNVGTIFGTNVYYSGGYRAIYNGNALFSAYGNNGIDMYAQVVAPGLFTPNSRLHISLDGNVGIGTTTPVAKLEVLGSARLYSGAFENRLAGNATSYVYSQVPSGTYATLGAYGISGPQNLAIQSAGGNVGIGTTTPADKLDVAGTILGSKLKAGTFGNDRIEIYNRADNVSVVKAFSSELFLGSAYNGISFQGSSDTNLMKLTDLGDLGIGTSTPSSRLSVSGGNAFINDAVITSGTPKAAITKEYLDSSLTAFNDANNLWKQDGSGLYSSSTSWNVGIGITNPSEKLEVAGGNIKVWDDSSLGANLMDAWANNATYPYETLTLNGTDIASAINTDTYGFVYDSFAGTLGKIYKITFDMTLNSGTMPMIAVSRSSTLTYYNFLETALPGSNTYYYYCPDTMTMYIGFYTSSGVATDFSVSNFSIKEVLSGNVTAKSIMAENIVSTGIISGSGTGGIKIDSVGNVGINLTSPTAKLHVNGGNANADSVVLSLRNHATVTRQWDFTVGSSATAYGGAYPLTISQNAATFYGDLIFRPGRNTIFQNGSVGIGTTTPSTKLHVNGTSLFEDLATFNQPVTVGTPVLNTHAATKSYVDSQLTGGAASGSFETLTVSGTTTLATVTGNVGIGISAPNYKLTVTDGSAPEISAASVASGNTISVQGNGAAYFMGRDVTNDIEFMMGTSIAGSVFAGSITSHPFQLRTGNTARLTIDAAGNVGIGTTAPGSKLSVVGDIALGPNGSAWPLIQRSAASGGYILNTSGAINSANSVLSVKNNGGGDLLTILGNGQIGIGSTTPQDLLHIYKAVGSAFSTSVRLSGSPTVGGGSAIFFKASGNETADRYGVKLGAVRSPADNGGAEFVIQMEKSSLAGLEDVLRIDQQGNVGIATTTPSARLAVAGGNIFIHDAAITSGTPKAAITKEYFDSSLSAFNQDTNLWKLSGNSLYSSSTSWNVGIGVTSPSAKLEVTGGAIWARPNETGATGTALSLGRFMDSNGSFFDIATNDLTGDNVDLKINRWNSTYNFKRSFSSGNGNVMSLASTYNGGTKLSLFNDDAGGNTERIRFDTNGSSYIDGGSLAIGVSNPGVYKLFVNGNTNIAGSLNVTGTTTASAFIGPLTGTMNAANVSSGAFGANTGGGNYSFPGNIAIGTSTAENSEGWDRVLHVNGALHSKIIATTNAVQVGLWAHNSGYYSSPGGGMVGTRSNHPLTLITSSTARMTIASGGNVGIGTTSPSTKLDVMGDIKASGILSLVGGAIQISSVGGKVNLYQSQGAALAYWDGSSVIQGLILNNSGNVGIGTTDPGAYRLKVSGDVAITGTLQTQTGSDFAEEFSVKEELEPGTVVVMDDNGHKSVKPCSGEYDKKVVGIVSDNPSIIAGKVETGKKAVVAMMGVVTVKASSVNGSIEKGDLITTSDIPGYAMKAESFRPGTIIGKALENLSGRRGEIKVLVNLQ